MTYMFRSTTEQETEALGRSIGRHLPDRVVVNLIGPLGAGKTALVRGVVSAVSADQVSSPTFVYHQRYQSNQGVIDHVDCYRLQDDPRKVDETGISELASAVPGWLLVEWPLETLTYPNDVPVVTVQATGAPEFAFSINTPDSISLLPVSENV